MLNDEGMKGLVLEAMYKSLDEKTRETLVTKALGNLPTSKDGYRSITPLQEAWNLAVSVIARQEVMKSLEDNSELRAKIKDLYAQVMTKVLVNEESLVDKMAEGIVAALKMERSERY